MIKTTTIATILTLALLASCKKDDIPQNRVRDIEGNVYKTVTIGKQVWMAENLKTTKYNDGADIPFVLPSATSQWAALTGPGYSWHYVGANYTHELGALYNYYTVSTGKLCPAGWHVPSKDEWNTLKDYLIANGYNFDGTTTGNKIAKSMAVGSGWNTSTRDGTPGKNDFAEYINKSGFSALPGGFRYSDGTYYPQSQLSGWWGLSDSNTNEVVTFLISYDSYYLGSFFDGNPNSGSYVRCIKD